MAARDVTVRIEGLDTLVRTLNRAAVDVSDLKDANRAAGDIAAGEARVRAPQGKTGKLSQSPRAARQARRARVMVGSARVPYAGPIHWGWPARNITSQPFAAVAAQATEPRWTAAYREALQHVLDTIRGT